MSFWGQEPSVTFVVDVPSRESNDSRERDIAFRRNVDYDQLLVLRILEHGRSFCEKIRLQVKQAKYHQSMP